MSGTHRHDGSSRASTTTRHPQDASDTHCLYRHPQDASNHADSSAVGKQQAFATPNGMLAKNPATLYKATARESHHYDASGSITATHNDSTNSRATLAEDTDDTYARVVTDATMCTVLQTLNVVQWDLTLAVLLSHHNRTSSILT
jgi:hypothetical protein